MSARTSSAVSSRSTVSTATRVALVAAILHCAVGGPQAATAASKWQCTPITMIHTRAVSTAAVSSNGSWVGPKYAVENANNANLWAALKFIQSECIDADTGVSDCNRKNNVSYVDVYKYKVCNPNNATWWFSPLKANGYGGQPTYNFLGWGKYVAFDDGACHSDDEFCASFNGNSTFPPLGNFVGWQNQSSDPRAPTPHAYWYSLPGSCPEWSRSSGKKTNDCIAKEPSGLCAAGVEPDGVNCTYSYEFLGEVSLDGLVGITAMGYNSYSDFCKAGNIEFERDSTTYEMIKGLPFWSDPTNQSANTERVNKFVAYFNNKTANPMNAAIPSYTELDAINPPCYCNYPQCASGGCMYDNSQVCVPCSASDAGCETKIDESKCKFGLPTSTSLSEVQLPKAADNNNSSSNNGSGGSSSGGGGGGGNSGSSSNSGNDTSSGAVAAAPWLVAALSAAAAVIGCVQSDL